MSNRSDISDITMSNRSELGEKSAQQPRTPLIKRKSGGASHLFCLDARTRRAWELVTLLFLGNVVQQSAAYLLIGLYSIDSSVGAHYSIRAATKLSPTVYGLMLGFIMDIPRAIANGLAGALAGATTCSFLARQTQHLLEDTSALSRSDDSSPVCEIIAMTLFRLKQCTFSCVKTRYQKVKMAKIGMRHMPYKSHAPFAIYIYSSRSPVV